MERTRAYGPASAALHDAGHPHGPHTGRYVSCQWRDGGKELGWAPPWASCWAPCACSVEEWVLWKVGQQHYSGALLPCPPLRALQPSACFGMPAPLSISLAALP
eukprot:1147004-Pelagomonas_calceolata.AAC.11